MTRPKPWRITCWNPYPFLKGTVVAESAFGKWFGGRARSRERALRELGVRQVYILPSRYGLLFAGFVLLMLLGAMNYMNNLGYMLAFLLVGLGLVAMLHTWRNLLGLRIEGGRAEPVFAGQEACFRLTVFNPRPQHRCSIRFQTESGTEITQDIPPGERLSVPLRVPAERRGLLRLGRVTPSTVYPLGLFRAWSSVRPDIRCLVYPKPAGSGEPPVAQVFAHNDEGDCGNGSDDYLGPRPYREGDSPRQIDWKAMARERGLISKQFGGSCAEQVVLDWDQLGDRDAETKLSLLCRFVLIAAEQDLAYQMHLPGAEIPLGRGESQRLRCLAALARFGEKP